MLERTQAMVFRSVLSCAGATSLVVQAVLMALSAGTFVFISLWELLPAALAVSVGSNSLHCIGLALDFDLSPLLC